MPVFVVCDQTVLPFGSEPLATKLASLLNKAGACNGSEHVLLETETADAARVAYQAYQVAGGRNAGVQTV